MSWIFFSCLVLTVSSLVLPCLVLFLKLVNGLFNFSLRNIVFSCLVISFLVKCCSLYLGSYDFLPFSEDDSIVYTEKCAVDQEFSSVNYKVAPDGFFTLKLLNRPSQFVFEEIGGLRIDMKGSYIAFEKKKHQYVLLNWFNFFDFKIKKSRKIVRMKNWKH